MKKKIDLREQQATITVDGQEVFVRFASGQIFGIHIEDLDTLHTAAHELAPKPLPMTLYQFEQVDLTEWEAKDEQGNWIVIRFLWDRLTVHRYDGRRDQDIPIFSHFPNRDQFLSEPMSMEEMLKITGYSVASYAS